MKNKVLIISGIAVAVVVLVVAIVLIIINLNKEPIENVVAENKTTEQEPLVVILDNKEEEQQEEEPEPVVIRDATVITQEIQATNANVGRLNIPKTGLNSDVYCKQDAYKMEVMPCMLYTNEGLNQKGVTVIIAHNRANDTLFSNNNQLEENDEFYFTDLDGVEKKYTVYSKFVTSGDDTSFYSQPVDVPVIAMQCCLTPTDEENVTIVMGKAEN